MTLNEYQRLAQRTSSTKTITDKLTNGCLGLAGETGEVCDIIKKHLFQGHDIDTDHIAEELGDILWYIAEVAHGIGHTLDDIADANISKLKRRYPDGFDSDRSVNRKKYMRVCGNCRYYELSADERCQTSSPDDDACERFKL